MRRWSQLFRRWHGGNQSTDNPDRGKDDDTLRKRPRAPRGEAAPDFVPVFNDPQERAVAKRRNGDPKDETDSERVHPKS
jgi:hypothetical protein